MNEPSVPAAERPALLRAGGGRLSTAGPHAAFGVAQVAGAPAPAASTRPLPSAKLSSRALRKSYRKGNMEIPVLRHVDLTVEEGDFVSIVGQSGSGKSTLLHVLATLDAPDDGQVLVDGRRIDNLSAAERDVLRNRHFGMIFQFYHLLPELTTLENVLLPQMIHHGMWAYLRHRGRLVAQAREILDQVGLSHRLRHKPRELSGGEMQRAAIARALVARPRILFADEPTGNLDKSTGQEILRILRSLNERERLTIVMVTHDQAIAAGADRTVRLVEGVLEAA